MHRAAAVGSPRERPRAAALSSPRYRQWWASFRAGEALPGPAAVRCGPGSPGGVALRAAESWPSAYSDRRRRPGYPSPTAGLADWKPPAAATAPSGLPAAGEASPGLVPPPVPPLNRAEKWFPALRAGSPVFGMVAEGKSAALRRWIPAPIYGPYRLAYTYLTPVDAIGFLMRRPRPLAVYPLLLTSITQLPRCTAAPS